MTARGAMPPAGSFDPIAQDFDRFAELVGGPLNAYLDGAFRGGDRAVDLGCGTGQHAAILAGRYREVLGVDISEPMLALARARRPFANVSYQHRDLRRVHAATDGRFDLVFSAYALHHVEDLEAALRGIRGLVAPGGRVVLVDNVAPRPAMPRRWFVGEAVRLLALDVLGFRRRPAEAWELFRLNVQPAWLDHVTSDRFLSPAAFDARFGGVFPQARCTPLYRARALCWDAPPDD
jgi:SAM-dependent methyltransferase